MEGWQSSTTGGIIKVWIALTVATLAVSLATPAFARHERTAKQEMKASLKARISDQRRRTWVLQDKMHVERWPTRHLEKHGSIPYLYQLAKLWKHRHRDALKRYRQATAWPAHHLLWLCIHQGEGAWDDPNSGGNGHYGGLQMHPGWGHGTSYYANQDSQLVQEQAAEEGYRESGYSRTWLNGQWGQTIGPCWQFA